MHGHCAGGILSVRTLDQNKWSWLDFSKLTINCQPEVLHGGRPKHEEPHVKKIKKRTYEKTEYILRVDLESLGINEDDFEDLQSLFEVDIYMILRLNPNLLFYLVSCTTETETEF